MKHRYRIVESPDGSVVVYDNSSLRPEVVWDFFETREVAEAFIDRTIRLEQVDERFMKWTKEITKELELESEEVLEGLRFTINTILWVMRHPKESQG